MGGAEMLDAVMSLLSGGPVLSLLTFLPAAGALLLLLLRGEPDRVDRACRRIALLVSLLTFGVSLLVLQSFDPTLEKGFFQFVEKHPLMPGLGISYHMGVDAIALVLILLTTFLMPIALMASRRITLRVREYMVAFLLLETLMIGTFCALDTFLFYVFFESVLIPMFLIIGIWGGPRRIYASFKFFLFTLLGSVLMLLAIIALYLKTGTTDMTVLLTPRGPTLAKDLQVWLWLGFLASFAVKIPMWPVHTWLPDAHVEAPTAGSIILAGVLLKVGDYGFMRFSLPMLPDASAAFVPMVWVLSLIAIVYASLVALVQDDMKKMIAYSSVAHMGFGTLGLFSFNTLGLQGAMFQMVAHGITSAALFFCVGVLYDRTHSRAIATYGGAANVMPKFAVFFLLMALAAIGVPGTAGFVGEFLSLTAIFTASGTTFHPDYEALFAWSQTVAVIAATGMVLSAAYMLWLYRRVMYGEVTNATVARLTDLRRTEFVALAVMGAVVLWLGIDSSAMTDFLAPSLDRLFARIASTGLCSAMPPVVPIH